MKTKLPTQLLSRSVAEALLFCKDVLHLQEFKDCGATIEFISITNDAFDILNSRKLAETGYKKATCRGNNENIKIFLNVMFMYVTTLKFPNGTILVESTRKTGFVGIIAGLKSVTAIYITSLSVLLTPF
jgi:hypothetical protein